jgi:hypothetical protein
MLFWDRFCQIYLLSGSRQTTYLAIAAVGRRISSEPRGPSSRFHNFIDESAPPDTRLPLLANYYGSSLALDPLTSCSLCLLPEHLRLTGVPMFWSLLRGGLRLVHRRRHRAELLSPRHRIVLSDTVELRVSVSKFGSWQRLLR